jgi:hypothetical protein
VVLGTPRVDCRRSRDWSDTDYYHVQTDSLTQHEGVHSDVCQPHKEKTGQVLAPVPVLQPGHRKSLWMWVWTV